MEVGDRAPACGLVGLWLLTELTPGLSRAAWGPGKNEETLLPFLCVSQSQPRLCPTVVKCRPHQAVRHSSSNSCPCW